MWRGTNHHPNSQRYLWWNSEGISLRFPLNDEKRGGDIDLLVRSTGEKKGVLARIRMTARLKLHLGDQKIDVIGDHEDSLVVQEALKNGIQLIWQKRKFTGLFFAWNRCYRHFEWTVFQKCLQRQQTRLSCDTDYSFPILFSIT